MKKLFFLAVIAYLFSACNNNDKKSQQSADSINNSSEQYLSTFAQQVKVSPDSVGLRLQYAFALDSLNRNKEALQQINILTSKDSSNYRLVCTRQYCRGCAGYTTCHKKLCKSCTYL